MTDPFRVLEFYSGIGGLRYSLKEAGVQAVVVEAFEINDIANDVYQHNFDHRPSQGNIQRLTVRQLDSYKADTWILSPPCQPYTRQEFAVARNGLDLLKKVDDRIHFSHSNVDTAMDGSLCNILFNIVAGLRKDAEDARAHSFLQMFEMLPQMKLPPHHILVENVVGFENSVTHGHLMDVFEEAGFVTQEFILSPLQLGIPYSRPRYFCLAKKKPTNFLHPEFNKSLLFELGPLTNVITPPSRVEESNIIKKQDAQDSSASEMDFPLERSDDIKEMLHPSGSPMVKMNEPILDPAVCCRPLSEFLEEEPCVIDGTSAPPLLRKLNNQDDEFDVEGERSQSQEGTSQVAVSTTRWELYKVPSAVTERWGDCFDIVTKDSKRCCCFTKSYGKYAKGTGSFLVTQNVWENEKKFESALTADDLPGGVSLASLGLRYFTPREMANLHSFPADFTFPPHVSLKQRYALLGNSLSVAVVGALLRYLFVDRNQQTDMSNSKGSIS